VENKESYEQEQEMSQKEDVYNIVASKTNAEPSDEGITTMTTLKDELCLLKQQIRV
jgi:hypothetical protein